MNESDVKRRIVREMHAAGGYAKRIEDQYAVGTYDMILIPKGLPVFMAEVKIIRGITFGPSPRQYIELCRIDDVRAAYPDEHVIPVVIGWRDGVYYFSPPAMRIRPEEVFSITTSDVAFPAQLIQYYHMRKK